jgi:tetratricopeptide (TPR) repeat protein
MRTIYLCTGLLLSLFLTGCGRLGISEYEKAQRGNALFSQAVNAEESGDVDGAIELYKRVMIDEPKAYSAHFMLATLLHDHAEDYIGAIYHYKRYIELEPESEKHDLAKQRISIAEHLLAPKILKKVGDTATGVSEARLLQDKIRLNGIIATLEGEKADLSEQVQKSDKMLKDLSEENVRLRKIVEKMKGDSFVELPDQTLKERIKDARSSDGGGTTGFSRTELESLRREAADMKEGKPSDTVKKPVVEVPSVKSVLEKVQNRLTGDAPAGADRKAELDKEARDATTDGDLTRYSLFNIPGEDAKEDESADEKQSYVVQPGDTLMRISTRFYGDGTKWKKIQKANRGQIGPDGRVRAGQNIVIP